MEKQRILELIKEEVFLPIDFFFAQNLLEELPIQERKNKLFLLCYLFVCARNGHLCLQILPNTIHPSPSLLTSDFKKKEEIQREVLLGSLDLSPSFCQDLTIENSSLFLKPIGRYKNLLYLQKNWLLESKFLSHLMRITRGALRLSLDGPFSLNPLLNEMQKEAVSLALTSPLCFISGGPGTGKTFTAAEIVKAFLSGLSKEQKKTAIIKISAPTGKAAAHLEKKIIKDLDLDVSIECGTLHSLLQIKSKRSFHQKTATLFADLFLIDEASMLDAKLF